jgi:predicted RNA methylase
VSTNSLVFSIIRSMNPIYDFSTGDHAVMVGDQVRLELYRRAIRNQVKPGMVVAEIGTGTGILSAFAAVQTTAPISAIEYAEFSAQMAEDMMAAAGFDQVKVVRGKSSAVTLAPPPQILITETIGAIGPEENIVEICHDFKKRHPSILKIIPAQLRVCAEPIFSETVQRAERNFYEAFASASFQNFNYDAIRGTLARIWSGQIRFDTLTGAQAVGPSQVMVQYDLGKTESAAFRSTVDLSKCESANAVHLFFEAQLDEEALLSTHLDLPETHWGHAYVSKPDGYERLTISYSSPADTLAVHWEK